MNDNGSQQSLFRKYFGRIAATAILFLFAVLVVTVGAIKAVFVAALTALGFYVGYLIDDKEALRKFLDQYIGRQ